MTVALISIGRTHGNGYCYICDEYIDTSTIWEGPCKNGGQHRIIQTQPVISPSKFMSPIFISQKSKLSQLNPETAEDILCIQKCVTTTNDIGILYSISLPRNYIPVVRLVDNYGQNEVKDADLNKIGTTYEYTLSREIERTDFTPWLD
jgi:hypothetical protein